MKRKPLVTINKTKRLNEGDHMVALSQQFGWVVINKPPKVSLMFDRKGKIVEPHYEYRVVVPATSKLVKLIPPKSSIPSRGSK